MIIFGKEATTKHIKMKQLQDIKETAGSNEFVASIFDLWHLVSLRKILANTNLIPLFVAWLNDVKKNPYSNYESEKEMMRCHTFISM